MGVFHSATPFRLLLIFLILSGIGMRSLRAELSEQEKKDLIRKAHQGSSRASSGKSSSSKSSSSKSSSGSSSKKKASSKSSTKSTSKSSSKNTSSSASASSKKHSSSSKKKSGAKSSSSTSSSTSTTAHAHSSGESKPAHSPSVKSTGTGSAESHSPVQQHSTTANDTPSTAMPLPHGATPSAPITIEKSGVEADQGLEPVPQSTPPPAPEGFWNRIFGSHRSYTYLSSSTRAAIDRAPVKRGRWKYIVIHNSGTREGNARVFDIYHKRVRHMQNGLAYHFVIGDGHGSGDGQVEVGSRWTRQINGGHVASDYLNDIALGICLVGDFNRDTPTKAQIGALEELVSYLRGRVGKSQGRQAIVHAHKEINPRPTDCPGDHFPYGWLHAKFRNAR
jgi:hypothetical protein